MGDTGNKSSPPHLFMVITAKYDDSFENGADILKIYSSNSASNSVQWDDT